MLRTHSIDEPRASVFFNFADLRLSVEVLFQSAASADAAMEALAREPSPIRMPAARMSDLPHHSLGGRFEVFCEIRDDDTVNVMFVAGGKVSRYSTPTRRFCRDFWKVLLVVTAKGALRDEHVVFHAACVGTGTTNCLVVGGSGVGKTTVAMAGLRAGAVIRATELTFTKHGRFMVGNQILDLPGARLAVPPEIIMDGIRGISCIVFPRLRDSDSTKRELKPARVRTLLFENAVGLTGITALLAHETEPIGIVPSKDDLDVIVREVASLSESPAFICEGPPDQIWQYIQTTLTDS